MNCIKSEILKIMLIIVYILHGYYKGNLRKIKVKKTTKGKLKV